jgi:hypothetical protein
MTGPNRTSIVTPRDYVKYSLDSIEGFYGFYWFSFDKHHNFSSLKALVKKARMKEVSQSGKCQSSRAIHGDNEST